MTTHDYRISTYEGIHTVDASTYGEWHDLNAEGEPCTTVTALREFISELDDQGIGWTNEQRDGLLADCDDLDEMEPERFMATRTWDVWGVSDREGGRWAPNDEASAEIEAAADPQAAAVEMCMESPARGSWHC